MKGSVNRLRVVRADKRVTQEALEAKLNKRRKHKISQTRISNIENGLDEPTDGERKAIARALRVSVEEVFPEPEPVTAPDTQRHAERMA